MTGAALRSTKHVSPLVVRQLWKHGSADGQVVACCICTAEQALPMLQQPLGQLLAAAVRTAPQQMQTPPPPSDCRWPSP